MKLDYGSLLSPEPITLSIGTLRSPTLREISRLTFPKFGMYQFFLSITPEEYFEKINKDSEYFNSLSDTKKEELLLYDIVTIDETLCNTYVEIFNFFFIERVIFREGFFVVLKNGEYSSVDSEIEITQEIIKSVIHKEIFNEVLELLLQLCYIRKNDEEDETELKFKNEKARKLWEKIKKAKEKEKAKSNINMTIPNIISSVSAKSNNLNIIDIWNITLFQLYDQFYKLQNDDVHYINSMRIAAWGDEKNTFDYSFWFRNLYDKN